MSSRSSRPEVFYKKVVLRNFSKLTRKHLCQSPFFNKVAGLKPETLLKERFWHRCFPVNFAKFLNHLFLQNTFGGCFWSSSIFACIFYFSDVKQSKGICFAWMSQIFAVICFSRFTSLSVIKNRQIYRNHFNGFSLWTSATYRRKKFL